MTPQETIAGLTSVGYFLSSFQPFFSRGKLLKRWSDCRSGGPWQDTFHWGFALISCVFLSDLGFGWYDYSGSPWSLIGIWYYQSRYSSEPTMRTGIGGIISWCSPFTGVSFSQFWQRGAVRAKGPGLWDPSELQTLTCFWSSHLLHRSSHGPQEGSYLCCHDWYFVILTFISCPEIHAWVTSQRN